MAENSVAKKSSYKKLVSNTLIFALGSFSSKILVILLVNVYTTYLSTQEMGVNDVIQQIANWLLPIVTMTVSESVIRFGLDKAYDKKQVFTIGNIACMLGFAGLGIVLPIVTVTGVADKYLQGYSLLIYVYIVAAALKQVYSYFVRALEKVKLYAVSSIITTLLTLIGTVMFICVFKMGNTGYLISIILADMCTTVFLLFAAKLWRFFDFRHIEREMLKAMFSYCLPLIPAQIMWLITNSSDSFMTTHYLGSDKNGILSASYKIANLVSTVYMMFGQAWNMSAILEDDSDDRNEFYGNVFYLNQCLMYMLAAGCLLIVQPLTKIWMGADFQESMHYSPIIIYSSIFSCFTTFMGSIYLASNRTKRSLVTSLISGVLNVSLNVVLIPRIGLYGPAISTVVSYLVVFIVRAYDSRKLVPFDLNLTKMVINNALLLSMVLINVMQFHGGSAKFTLLTLPILFLIILIINIKPVWNAVLRVMPEKIRNIIERLGTKRIIALAVAFAVFCAAVWFTKGWLLLAVFAAAAAYGAAAHKELTKLCGGVCIFISVWVMYGISSAFLAMLVLSAMDYLANSDRIDIAVGSLSLIVVVSAIGGVLAAVFCALLIIAAAAVTNIEFIFANLAKLTNRRQMSARNKNGKRKQ